MRIFYFHMSTCPSNIKDTTIRLNLHCRGRQWKRILVKVQRTLCQSRNRQIKQAKKQIALLLQNAREFSGTPAGRLFLYVIQLTYSKLCYVHKNFAFVLLQCKQRLFLDNNLFSEITEYFILYLLIRALEFIATHWNVLYKS